MQNKRHYMPEKRTKFHEFALKSILFKGRNDWYFCYVKAEKIAHVLAVLGQTLTDTSGAYDELLAEAAALPGDIAHMAAGEVEVAVVLADVFALLSRVRAAQARGVLHEESASILAREYEQLAERLVSGSNPSPFMALDDLVVEGLGTSFAAIGQRSPETPVGAAPKQEIPKGHKGQTGRMSAILEVIRKQKNVSIKDIAAKVTDCSEKTIQRELTTLIEQGLVRKVGERRWSVYIPT